MQTSSISISTSLPSRLMLPKKIMEKQIFLFLLLYFSSALVFAQFRLQAFYDNPNCYGVPYYANIEQGSCHSTTTCSQQQGFSVNCSSTNYFGYTEFNRVSVVYPFTPIPYLALVSYNDKECRTLNTTAPIEYFLINRCLPFTSSSKESPLPQQVHRLLPFLQEIVVMYQLIELFCLSISVR